MPDLKFFKYKWLDTMVYNKQQNKPKFPSDNEKDIDLKVKQLWFVYF